MMIHKLIIDVLAAVTVFNFGASNRINNNNENTRTENGYLISFIYNENGDYMTSTIVTDDGNVWEVDDFVCNRGARLQVTFDTMDTDDITDDQVIKIVATVEA